MAWLWKPAIFIGRYWGLFLATNLIRLHASLLVKAGNSFQRGSFHFFHSLIASFSRRGNPIFWALSSVYYLVSSCFPENSTDPRNYLKRIPENLSERFVPYFFVRFWSRKSTLGFSFDRRSREPAHDSENHHIPHIWFSLFIGLFQRAKIHFSPQNAWQSNNNIGFSNEISRILHVNFWLRGTKYF